MSFIVKAILPMVNGKTALLRLTPASPDPQS